MEKQYGEQEAEPAPPYEESDTITELAEKPAQPSPLPTTAQQRAEELRQQRVKLLIDGQLEPLLETAILHGNSQTIIIVPSDAIETSTVLATNNLVNRPKSSVTHIVQLQGPNSTGSFWMQPRVVEGLEDGIREILYGQHGKPRSTEVLPPRPASLSSPVTGQKSWLKRTFGAPSPDQDPTGSTGHWKLGWRSEHTNMRPPNSSEDGLSVRQTDVAFRMETELGLLTTTTAKCIVFELASTAMYEKFQLRRSALRVLSSAPSSYLAKPRTLTTFTSSVRVPPRSVAASFQRRWATNEAEAKHEEEEPPISQIQPTPQEEVENAIQSDNASESPVQAEAQAESSESGTTQAEAQEAQGAIESVVESATAATSKAAETVKETVQDVYQAATGSSREARPAREGSLIPKPTIYIGNLFFDVTENDLVKELARFGTITNCRLMRDSRGLSKGFGYVDFETTESATKAIETLHQQLFEGRRLAVQYAAFETSKMQNRPNRSSQPMNPPSKTLFIGNMSFEMTDRDLNDLFRGIRNVIDVRVAIDRRTGQPRGFAHADFVDVKSAMDGMKELQGKETYGRRLRVDYSYGPSTAPRNRGAEE